MSFESLVTIFGYPAIAIGTFLEGETILLMAGFSAHQGYLKLPWVVIWGLLGTLSGDQFYFYLGRIKGIKMLDKRQYWKSRSKLVSKLLNRHQLMLVLGFRFLYGLRTVTPFLLGASDIGSLRFFILNFLGAFIWSITIAVSGYFFGHILEKSIGNIERYEFYLFLSLGVLGVIVWSVHWFKKKKMTRQPDKPGG